MIAEFDRNDSEGLVLIESAVKAGFATVDAGIAVSGVAGIVQTSLSR